MTSEERRIAINEANERLKKLPWTPLIPYLYCCVCFTELNENNILDQGDHLVDVCLECKDK